MSIYLARPITPVSQPDHPLLSGSRYFVWPDTQWQTITGQINSTQRWGLSGSPWGIVPFASDFAPSYTVSGKGFIAPPDNITLFFIGRVQSNGIFNAAWERPIVTASNLTGYAIEFSTPTSINFSPYFNMFGVANVTFGVSIATDHWVAIAISRHRVAGDVTLFAWDYDLQTFATASATSTATALTGDGIASVADQSPARAYGGSLAMAGFLDRAWSANDFRNFVSDPFALVRLSNPFFFLPVSSSIPISDTLTFSPTLSHTATFNRSFSNSLSFAPTIFLEIPSFFSLAQLLSFSQSLSIGHISPVVQSLSFSQSIDFDHSLSTTHNRKSQCLEQIIDFSQTIDSYSARHIRHTLFFRQDCINYELDHHVRVYNRSISHALSFSQSLTFSKNSSVLYSRSIAQSLTFSQTLNVSNNSLPQLIADTLVFSQTAIGHAIVAISQSISQSLSFSSSVSKKTIRPRFISDSLSFSSSQTSHRYSFLSLKQTFSFSQSLTRNLIFLRYLSDTIDFSIPITRYLNYNTPIVIPNPIVIIQHSNVPNVVLAWDAYRLELPPPLFDDSESGLNSVSVKRTMVGGSRSYVRSTNRLRLRYSFRLGRQQAYFLKDFLYRSNAKPIAMSNWKYELYAGYVTTNLVSVTEQSIHNNTVDLEFDMLRLS